MGRSRPGRRPELIAANAVLIALLVVHSLDHQLRQDAAVPEAAASAGAVGLVGVIAALALALAGSRLASVVTAVVCLGTAAGFVAVHVLPEWSAFSQPYADIDADALSWVAMLVPASVAAAIGVVAARGQ